VLDGDNAEQLSSMAERGRELARRLNPARYHAHLVELARQAVVEPAQRVGEQVDRELTA
jgi:hypothetical protein